MDPQVLTNMPVQAVQHPFVVDEDGVLKIRVGKGRRESTHPRMVCTELYMHLTARTSPTGQPETDAAFYSAQMMHYGIPGDSHLARAKKSLLDTFRVKPDGTGVLHVPETIKTIERNLKKQYKTLLTKSKLIEAERRKAAELQVNMKALKAEQSKIRSRDEEIDVEMRVLEEKAEQVRENLANLDAVERDQTVPEKVEDLEEPGTDADDVGRQSTAQSSDESEHGMDNEPIMGLEPALRPAKGHALLDLHGRHVPNSREDTVATELGDGSSDVSEDDLENGTQGDVAPKPRSAKSRDASEPFEEEIIDSSLDESDNATSGDSDDSDCDLTHVSSERDSGTRPKRKAICPTSAPSEARVSKRTRTLGTPLQSEGFVEEEAGLILTGMSHSVRALPNAASNKGDSPGPASSRSSRCNTTPRSDSNPPSAHSAAEHRRRELLKRTSGSWTISTQDGDARIRRSDLVLYIGKWFQQTDSVYKSQLSSAYIKGHYMWFRFGDSDVHGCTIAKGNLVNGKLKLVFTWRSLPAYDPIETDKRKFELLFDQLGNCEGRIYGSPSFVQGFTFWGQYLSPLASDESVVDFSNAYYAVPRSGASKSATKSMVPRPINQLFSRQDGTPQAALQGLVDRFQGQFTIISPTGTLWAGKRRPSISIGLYCAQDADVKGHKRPQEIIFVGRIRSDNFRAYIVADSTPNISHLSEGGLNISFTWRTPTEKTADGRMAEGKFEVFYKGQAIDGILTGCFLSDPIRMKTGTRRLGYGKAHTWWNAFHGWEATSAKEELTPPKSQRTLEET